MFLILLVTSCGFHLRGQGTSNFVGDYSGALIYLAVTSRDKEFHRRLKMDLQLANFSITDEPEKTSHHLIILSTTLKRRVVGTDRNGRDNEFETTQTAEFIVNESIEITPQDLRNGEKIENPEYENQIVRAHRTYYFDNNDPIGKKTEEESLNQSMREELSRKIISHLAVGLSQASKQATN